MPESGEWLIRTADGMLYIVHIKMVDLDMIHVDESVWVADTAIRLNEFIKDGPKNGSSELEEMGPGLIPRSLVAGLWRWGHGIPGSM